MKKIYFFLLAMIVSFAAQAWTVKFTNPNNWENVNVNAWNGTGNCTNKGAWPGDEMTKEGDVWTYSSTNNNGYPSSVAFNNGSTETDTFDFDDDATYNLNGVVTSTESLEDDSESHTYVYFYNSKNWDAVYSYCWTPNDNIPFTELETVEIDGKTLYRRDAGSKQNIIFLNKPNWTDQQQTGNLEVINGAVYNAASEYIADIVDGRYVEREVEVVEHTGVYLRGTMNDWGMSNDWEFTKEGNDYKISVTLDNGTAFKIANGDWSFNYGGDLTIEPGKTYTLSKGTNDNMKSQGLYGVTLTFNEDTAELTVSEATVEEPERKWFAAWDFGDGNGWQFGHEMEKQAEGTYKYLLDMPEGSGNNFFAVFQGESNTGWGDGTRYVPEGNQDMVVTETGTYKMQVGSNGAWTLGENGLWTIVVDPRDQAQTTIYFDRGNSVGLANIELTRNGVTTSYGLEEDPENVFTATVSIQQDDMMLFNIEGKYYNFSRDTERDLVYGDDNSELIYTYTLNECTADDAIDFWYDADCEFVIDVENMTVKVTVPIEGGVSMALNETIFPLKEADGVFTWSGNVTAEAPVRINIRGTKYTFDPAIVTIEKVEGTEDKYNHIYTLLALSEDPDNRGTIEAVGECDFIINVDAMTFTVVDNIPPTEEEMKPLIIINGNSMEMAYEEEGIYKYTDEVNEGDIVTFSYEGVSYGFDSTTSLTKETNTLKYALVQDFANPLTFASKQATFTVNYNTMEVTVEGSFTTSIDTVNVEDGVATYFNLQGVKVSNPENGLYIRVQNGKATKVLVK